MILHEIGNSPTSANLPRSGRFSSKSICECGRRRHRLPIDSTNISMSQYGSPSFPIRLDSALQQPVQWHLACSLVKSEHLPASQKFLQILVYSHASTASSMTPKFDLTHAFIAAMLRIRLRTVREPALARNLTPNCAFHRGCLHVRVPAAYLSKGVADCTQDAGEEERGKEGLGDF